MLRFQLYTDLNYQVHTNIDLYHLLDIHLNDPNCNQGISFLFEKQLHIQQTLFNMLLSKSNINTFNIVLLMIHAFNIKFIKTNEILMNVTNPTNNNCFTTKLSLILCNLDTKIIYVYVENQVNSELIDELLQKMYSNKMCITPIFILIRYKINKLKKKKTNKKIFYYSI